MSHPETPMRSAIPTSSTARTWIAAFDGGRAAVFRNAGFDDAPSLELVFSAENSNKPTRELGRDKPGRTHAPGGRQAGLEPNDLHSRREGEFLDSFFERIEQLASANQFDRLVLLAPGHWIRRFSERAPAAQARVSAALAGDYAHAYATRLEAAFKEALARGKQLNLD